MSEDLIESKPLSEYVNSEPETTFKKTETGLKELRDPPRPPDFISDQHSACAWVSNRNPEGEIIALNVKIGDFYFKLRKRFF